MEGFVRDENRIYLIVYHLAWLVQRGKSVLVGEARDECEHLIRDKCDAMGWTILELKVEPDHIELIVQTFPKDCAYDIIQKLKRATSSRLQTYPNLKKLPGVWTKNYFAATSGSVDALAVKRYVELEKERT